MPPKKIKEKSPVTPSTVPEIKPPEEPAFKLDEDAFAAIELNVVNLESKVDTGMFTLIIVYGNNLLGKVGQIVVPTEGGKVKINRKFYLQIKSGDNYLMDALLSTPFFFSLLEGEERMDLRDFEEFGFAAALQSNVTGQGNLGLLPLLTGQNESESYVILEPPGYQETIFFERKYSEHPKLFVKLTDVRKSLSSIKLHNIMWLSVESIYNVDAINFMETADHTMVFPMPATTLSEEQFNLRKAVEFLEEPQEIKPEERKTFFAKKGKKSMRGAGGKSVKPSASKPILKRTSKLKKDSRSSTRSTTVDIQKPFDFDLIQFDRGIYMEQPTTDIRKKWSSLASINGAPAMTKEKIKTDSSDLLSVKPFNMGKKFRSEREPRIEWNMIRPIWLHESLERNFKNRILQYGVWPFELLMIGKIYTEQEEVPGDLKKIFCESRKQFEAIKNKIDAIFCQFYKLVDYANKKRKSNKAAKAEVKKKLEKLKSRINKILKYAESTKRWKNKLTQLKSRRLLNKRLNKNTKDAMKPRRKSKKAENKERTSISQKLSNQAITILERRAYVAWIDLSPLLSPGCTHLRTTGLLQFFNKEEAVARWGLATTFSGIPDELDPADEAFTRTLQTDNKELLKLYRLIKKSKLLKNPMRFMLLLGRLIDLRYKNPNEFRPPKWKKYEKELVAHRETTVDPSLEKFEDPDKKKVRFGSDGRSAKIEKREMDGSASRENVYEVQDSVETVFSYNTDDIKFADTTFDYFVSTDINRTDKNSNSMRNVMQLPSLTQLDSTKITNKHKKKNRLCLKNKLTQTVFSASQMTSFPRNIFLPGHNKQISYSEGEKLLIKELTSKLINVVNKYSKLKKRYKLLRTVKQKYIEKIRPQGKDGNKNQHTKIRPKISRVDPRHKMWHIGTKLDEKNAKNQSQITNVVRKLAVMERKFLLLKRLRLEAMKSVWKQKARELEPEYFFNRHGEHVFVIIDIKLLKPLVPSPDLNKLELDIENLLTSGTSKKKVERLTRRNSYDDFNNCILMLTKLISSEFQDYKKLNSSGIIPFSDDFEQGFYEHLEKSRAHRIMSDLLTQGMASYLANGIGSEIPIGEKDDQKKLRYYVGWVYSRLVDEMQTIVNRVIIGNDRSLPEPNTEDLPNIGSEDLYLFAVEAIEEMDYSRAKYYLSKRLDLKNRTVAIRWVDYAVIALRIGDYQQAIECLKEAVLIDTRCKEALILYAVMLMIEGKFDDAQLFFTAIICYYPMFIEGWMAAHMFYLIVENKSGADIALVAGTKICRDHKTAAPYIPPQLSWDNSLSMKDEPGNYMTAAVYFLSFNLYEFAEVCLAQELERTKCKTASWVYYLSVCHYIQGRYEDSAKHLAKAITEAYSYNTEPRVWMLLGHCCWQMGMKKCAVQLYIQAFTKNQSMKYAHMTYIRCGFFFLENEKHEFAKQMFLRALKEIGTPMGWLGIGIALFMGGQMDDAEIALREANMLDPTLATAWGYLALISLYKLKQDQFLFCYQEAKRYGLKDKKLAIQIEMISQEILSHSRKLQFLNYGHQKYLL